MEPANEAPEAEGERLTAGSSVQLSAADVVYLHRDFFLSHRARTRGESPEGSIGREVRKRLLAQTMVLAALASLVKEGWIELAVANVGVLLTSSAPVLRRVSAEPYPHRGLEAALFSSLRSTDRLDSVEQVIRRAIGEGQPDPWDGVLAIAREHLDEIRQLGQEGGNAAGKQGPTPPSPYSFEPDLTLVSASLKDAYRVQSTLLEVRSLQPWAWELAAGQVEQGLKSCQPKSG